MRVLVLGATGYVGSRLVPALLEAGHEVVAASSSPAHPARFAWGGDVTWRQCDVTDETAVRRVVRDAEGVCYLVHALRHRGFSELDRVGAAHVRDAASAAGVRRVVYLSGLVPTLERGQALSEHLASRLEVEQILAQTSDQGDCSVLTLRAGVVIGAGSTSFEVVRQLASLLLVQPVPPWMRTRVQPVAVSDVVRALVAAYGEGAPTGAVDLGGPDVLSYPDLLAAYARVAGLPRLRVPAPVAPVSVVGLATAALVGAPFWTVTALVESLRHDMVCRPGHLWVPDGEPMLGVDEALARSLGQRGADVPEAPLASDPAWTRMRAPVLDELNAPAFVRAGTSLALRRLAGVRGVFRNGVGS